MKIQLPCLVIVLSAAFIRCNDQPTQPVPAGAYQYTSYDTLGAAMVTGWFAIQKTDSNHISGEWHFSPLAKTKDVGPQTGDGNFAGTIDGNQMYMEIDPQYIDNNLELSGTIQGNRYSGRWTWISFVGVTNHGNFEAVKK